MARSLLAAAAALCLAACAHVQPAQQGARPLAGLQDWSARELPGKRATQYSLGQRAGQACVLAQAQESASLWRRQLTLLPQQVERLEFEWWIAGKQAMAADTDPDLDDAPARLVLAFEGDEARLSGRNRMLFELARVLTGESPPYATLMYVWDPRRTPETVVVNARTDRIRKIVVGNDAAGQWQSFRRDIAADFKKAFGEEPGRMVGAALMTDADNSPGRAEACYGSIRFVDQQANLLPGSLIF